MKIKVYSTQMGEKEVETKAETWGDLQTDLRDAGVSFHKMKAVIGESKLTLEADGALLPPQGFTLFLMNKKTKAGLTKKQIAAYKYGELRSTIRTILHLTPKTAEYFNTDGNYTTKSTDKLRDLLSKFTGAIPDKDVVDATIAELKSGKGKKKKPVAKKVKAEKPVKQEKKEEVVPPIKVKKNEIPEPKRGFGADTDTPTKKKETPSPVISKAQDIVDSLKEHKEEEEELATMKETVPTIGMVSKLFQAINLPKGDTIKKLHKKVGKMLGKLSDAILEEESRIAKEQAEAAAKAKKKAEKKAKKEAEKKAKEEAKKKAEADAKAKEEAEAKAKEEAAARAAKAKEAEEKAARESALKAQMSDMMGEFDDVKR